MKKKISQDNLKIAFLKALNKTESVTEVLELVEKIQKHRAQGCNYGQPDGPADFIKECECCFAPEKCFCYDCDVHPYFSPAIIYEKEK